MTRARSPVEDVIRSRVEEHPDAVWLKFRDEVYTWREVLSNILRAANGLLDIGVRPGTRGGAASENWGVLRSTALRGLNVGSRA